MKKFRQLFQEAERLTPPPGLWRQIEAQVKMEMRSESEARHTDFWRSPLLRAAASVVLAVGFLGLGISMRHHAKQVAAVPASNVRADADAAEQTDLVDPELLGWHADLGEVDMEAEEAGEVL